MAFPTAGSSANFGTSMDLTHEFLSGERLEDGSPTEMAVRVLQYANDKDGAAGRKEEHQ
jgi:hypothetical protein